MGQAHEKAPGWIGKEGEGEKQAGSKEAANKEKKHESAGTDRKVREGRASGQGQCFGPPGRWELISYPQE